MQIPGISEREWGRRRHGFSSTPFPFAFPFVSSLFPAAPAGACPAASRGPHPLAPLAAPSGVVSHN